MEYYNNIELVKPTNSAQMYGTISCKELTKPTNSAQMGETNVTPLSICLVGFLYIGGAYGKIKRT